MNPKTYKQNAVLNNKGYYQHFGVRPTLVSLYGVNEKDIVEISFVISDDQNILPHDQSMNPDYWGWLDAERNDFTMIYAKRFLLEMCFPYGIKGSEDAKQGKAYRLEIIFEDIKKIVK